MRAEWIRDSPKSIGPGDRFRKFVIMLIYVMRGEWITVLAGCIGRGDQLRSIVGRRDQIITYGIVINGSEPQVCEKVSGTEPDFVQKLGTEPKFSGDAASLSCLRVNHSFGRMYLARRRTSFNSLARSRNNEGLEGSERRAFIQASKSQNPRYVFAPGPKYVQ